MRCGIYHLIFFFQAEDGIRDDLVTGVQTCALPIYDKLHQRAETPNGRRPEKVQSRHRRLEPLAEPRISLEATYGLCQLRGKEIVLGNVHSIARSQKNMVDGSLASVI